MGSVAQTTATSTNGRKAKPAVSELAGSFAGSAPATHCATLLETLREREVTHVHFVFEDR